LSREFVASEQVLLVDNRRRRHLVTLVDGGQFHTHAGIIAHDDIIGHPDGSTVRTTRNARLTALRPTLAEYILEMPRGAQVIYPKDIGPILILADIFPGARILESGVGSGALTSALLRAVGPTGSVMGYEIRDDFAQRATENVHGFLGTDVPLQVQVRDVYEGIEERDVDRVVLDLPEPWRVVKHAAEALVPGGILLSYLPTILQVGRLREELVSSPFAMAESLEVMHRGWHVEGQSIRPDHRMVAHTGFLTVARRLADDGRAEPPVPSRAEPVSEPQAPTTESPEPGGE
jgi:tRNA (adenine57-N1/adenine58-N1)-methyltransferase